MCVYIWNQNFKIGILSLCTFEIKIFKLKSWDKSIINELILRSVRYIVLFRRNRFLLYSVTNIHGQMTNNVILHPRLSTTEGKFDSLSVNFLILRKTSSFNAWYTSLSLLAVITSVQIPFPNLKVAHKLCYIIFQPYSYASWGIDLAEHVYWYQNKTEVNESLVSLYSGTPPCLHPWNKDIHCNADTVCGP